MKPENMPYYQGPRFTTKDASTDTECPSASSSDANEAHHLHCQSIMSAVVHHDCHGLSHLSNIPVRFGNFDCITPIMSHASINHKIPTYTNKVLSFSWAVYSFVGGHFMSTILSRNLPFHVKLACDQYEYGHALFREFIHCPNIFGSSGDLLHHICASGNSSQIHGYLIHFLRFKDSNMTPTFWQIQATIIAQLCSQWNLQLLVVIIIPDHDGRCILLFKRTLKAAGWCISMYNNVSFTSIGDAVAGGCNLLFGVHSSCTTKVELFQLKPLPPVPPRPLSDFLWEPFSQPEHSVSLACNDEHFCRQDVRFTATTASNDIPIPQGVTIKYFIHGPSSDESSLCGTAVVSVNSMCPPFDASANQNMFQHLLGIKFHFGDHTHVRGISPFEFA
jgi:hypothetical protein